MPLSNYGITLKRTSTTQYSSGIIGAKTGFFAEMGLGMNLSNPDNMVGVSAIDIGQRYGRAKLFRYS